MFDLKTTAGWINNLSEESLVMKAIKRNIHVFVCLDDMCSAAITLQQVTVTS